MCLMANEKMASLTEALAYIMPRTYESPMQREWVDIYTWLGMKYVNSFRNFQDKKGMEGIAPDELSNYEIGLLDDLRRWIYKKRREALKTSLRYVEKQKPNQIIIKQSELF